jgi:hypothetical protein
MAVELSTSGRLLERESFLQVLAGYLAEAQDGAGRLVLLAGEAGIGKTALVQRFADEHRAEARVLRGACDSLRTPRPLGHVRRMFAPWSCPPSRQGPSPSSRRPTGSIPTSSTG